jgi:hypothetical protein
MEDSGIAFSWGWFWATLLGAVLGFVAGEIIDAVVTTLWSRRGNRKRTLPEETPEPSSPWLKRSHTKTSPR